MLQFAFLYRLLASCWPEAGEALSQAKLALAQQALTQVFAEHPEHIDAQFLYGVVCLMGGDATKAIGFLRKAVAQRPTDANMQMYLGCALHDAGMLDEALTHLHQACELAPRQPPGATSATP